MLARTGISPTAQLYLYRPVTGGTFVWNAVGPALELEDSGLTLKRWLRLTVRTDTAGALSDLWMDRKLTVINHPPVALTAGSFTLRLATGQSAWMDDFITGDTHPLYTDTDRDALPDLYEYEQGLNASANDRNADKDGDTLTNITEYWLGTKANGTDSDGDGMPDQWESLYGLNPVSTADRDIDLDLDGYTNFEEFNEGTNPADPAANAGSVVYVKTGFSGKQLGTFDRPFERIQSALDAVPSGGRVVLLGSGGAFTGSGNINLAVSRPVTIVGRANAVINGQGGGYGVYTTYPPSSGPLVVEDITFQQLSGSDGGAVYSDQVPVTLRRCIFTQNNASDDGGAVFVNSAACTVQDCVFTNGLAADKGGAICAEFSPVSIQRCRFLSGNLANGAGSAMYFRGCSGTVSNCLVQNNGTSTGGTGAVTFAEGATVAVKFSTILSNTSASTTGGLCNLNPAGAAPITVDSCILWDNRITGNVKNQLNTTAAWSATYCTVESTTLAGTGNNTYNPNFIAGTPLFATTPYTPPPYGIYNAGNATANPGTDLDGAPRDPLPDRGCIEYSDSDGDGMPSAWELANQFNPNDPSDGPADADQDGFTNFDEYLYRYQPRYAGASETAACIYVDPINGSDAGATTTFTTPVRTIGRSLAFWNPYSRWRICLRDGIYKGTGNRNLVSPAPINYSNSFLLKSINGPGKAIIDLQDTVDDQRRFIQMSNIVASTGYMGTYTFQDLVIRGGKLTGANGGGILLKSGHFNLSLNACRFISCSAVSGGAAYAEATTDTAQSSHGMITAKNCEFLGCSASGSGGAIAIATPVNRGNIHLLSSTFSYNSAGAFGGAVYSPKAAGIRVNGCVFYRNNAAEGGALAGTELLSTWSGMGNLLNFIQNSTFTENTALSPTANAASHAGALWLDASPTQVQGCTFTANTVGANGTGSASGGAVYLVSGAPKFFRCTFADNEAALLGGAIRVAGGTPWIVNSALKDNQAGTEGGGISVKAPAGAVIPAPIIAHCTLVWNRSPQGAALYYRSNTSLFNSLSWFNVHDAAHTSLEGTATLTATGNNLSSTLAGNVSTKPTLAFDNIHLAGPLPPTSPNLLNTASASYVSYTSEILPGTSTATAIACDFDAESRATANLEAGCDEWQDTDADGLPDWFENYIIKYSGNDALNSFAAITPALRLWNSQWTLAQMFSLGGDPLRPDMAQADDDDDGLTNLTELGFGTDPYKYDTDDDGLADGWEKQFESVNINALTYNNPNADPDADGVPNYKEQQYKTNPNVADSDNDGATDKQEIDGGTNPSDPNDKPDPANPKPVWKVNLTVGDNSSSLSEHYKLLFYLSTDQGTKGTKLAYSFEAAGPGRVRGPEEFILPPSEKGYFVELYWIKSRRPKPDFDYTVGCSRIVGEFFVYDSDGIIGSVTGTMSDANAANAKVWKNDSHRGVKKKDVEEGHPIKLVPCDIDARTVSHNVKNGDLKEQEEETPGAFIPFNNDDDNYTAVPGGINGEDYLETAQNSGPLVRETDLLPFVIRKSPIGLKIGLKFQLTIPAGLRVWRNPDCTSPVTSATVFTAAEIASTTDGLELYAEGIVQDGAQIINLIATCDAYGWPGYEWHPDVDRIQITNFGRLGPLNVPGYSIHRYKLLGVPPAGGKWIAPGSGTIKTGANTSDVTILWDGGPVEGKAIYEASANYIWDLEVNVVEIASGTTNILTYTKPVWGPQNPLGELMFASNVQAMDCQLSVERVEGPIVGGSERGKKFLQMGIIQNGVVTQNGAHYPALTAPNFRQSDKVFDPPYLDALGASNPWYADKFVVGELGIKGWIEIKIDAIPETLHISDGPAVRFTEPSVNNQALGLTGISFCRQQIDFHLYFAARTVQTQNSANLIYTQRAKANWLFGGYGEILPGQAFNATGVASGDAQFVPVPNGDPVPKTTGPIMNLTQQSFHWTTWP